MQIPRRTFLALGALLAAEAFATPPEPQSLAVPGLGRVFAASGVVTAPGGASLRVVRQQGTWKRFFLVTQKPGGLCAFVPYSEALAHFYRPPAPPSGWPPLIFEMAVAEPRAKNDPDSRLGAWEGGVHRIPVYAFFETAGGRVTLEDRVFSATYLNPSHYHDEMRSPAHLSLVRALVELMPPLTGKGPPGRP